MYRTRIETFLPRKAGRDARLKHTDSVKRRNRVLPRTWSTESPRLRPRSFALQEDRPAVVGGPSLWLLPRQCLMLHLGSGSILYYYSTTNTQHSTFHISGATVRWRHRKRSAPRVISHPNGNSFHCAFGIFLLLFFPQRGWPLTSTPICHSSLFCDQRQSPVPACGTKRTEWD